MLTVLFGLAMQFRILLLINRINRIQAEVMLCILGGLGLDLESLFTALGIKGIYADIVFVILFLLHVQAGIVFLVFALEFADTFFIKIHNHLGEKGTFTFPFNLAKRARPSGRVPSSESRRLRFKRADSQRDTQIVAQLAANLDFFFGHHLLDNRHHHVLHVTLREHGEFLEGIVRLDAELGTG